MYATLICLLAAVGAWGADAQAISAMRLYTDFEKEPAAPVRAAIRNEVDEIMSPIGWSFAWSPASESRSVK